MSRSEADVAIVGAGILGLAHAYIAAKAGKSVVVIEKSPRAAGASVTNFGMVWPIGQPAGVMLELSLRSRELWLEILDQANLPRRETGSLHVTYRADEAAVAQEFAELGPRLGYACSWLKPGEVLKRSQAVQPDGLAGGLWSSILEARKGARRPLA
jgi:D-hydroxyproline dehydrogenase subunit beta